MKGTKMNTIPISLCPTGIVPRKKDNPFVPMTPKEIVSDVIECFEIGFTSVHLHARDELENPAWEKNYYQKIISGIRSFNEDIVICVTTSGRSTSAFDERTQALELTGECKPDMGSLTLSSMNFLNQESVNSPAMVQEIANKMLELGIKPELEVFDMGMINYIKYLHQKNILKPPFVINLLLGNVATMQSTMLELGVAIESLPTDSVFLVAGLGRFQLQSNTLGIISGGGVRVGLEDNLFMDKNKQILAKNQSLLSRVVDLAAQFERYPMSAKVFKEEYLS